jgi:hypothetical protein
MDPDSHLEINISGPLKLKFVDVVEALEKLSDDPGALESWKKTMIENIFPDIIKELITNLMDPYSRFQQAALFRELCLWVFSDSSVEYRERISSQKSSHQILLNQLITWDKELKVPHPLKILSTAFELITSQIESKGVWKEDGTFDHYKVQNDRNCKSWIYMNEMICQLQVINLEPLSELERKVFFLNVYNLMMIHGSIATNGISHLVLKRNIFYKEVHYNIGGELYSLEMILNGILRGNVSYSTNLSFGNQKFTKNDPRKEFVLPFNSPDILFALMTLTSVSPDFVVYEPEKFDEQLKEVKNNFIKQHVVINSNSKVLLLPSIFMDYKKDFQQKGKTIEASIKAYIGEALNLNVSDYKLKENESSMKLSYLNFISDITLRETIMKSQPVEKVVKKSNQTLKQKVDEKLEQIKTQLVPLDDIESLTTTQIHGKGNLILKMQLGC